MGNFFQSLFDIREGEGSRTALMFAYIFLIIASLLIVKPARNAIFLTAYGVEALPYAFMLVAVFAALVTVLYSNYAGRLNLYLLINRTMWIILASVLFFWYMLTRDQSAGWLVYGFYIWVAIFGVITTSQFWLLANYVFNAREAKRLFGLIGAGGISGGIFGGYLTTWLASPVGTENLLIVCFGFLLVCMFILRAVWRAGASQNYRERMQQQKRLTRRYDDTTPLRQIFLSPHLISIAGLVGISVLVANLVDFQYSAIAADIIKDEDELTAFFGFWLSNLSLLSLAFQLFFTGKLLKTFGVGPSLFFLPIGILVGAVAVLVQPGLASAIAIKVGDGSFKQSINKAALELLTLPIPAAIKNRVKAFIDVFVDNLATGGSGLLLAVAIIGADMPVAYVSYLILALCVIWVLLNRRAEREYINSFREALEKRTIDLEDQRININDASVVESLLKSLQSDNDRQVIYALDLIGSLEIERFTEHLRRLLEHPLPEIRLRTLVLIGEHENPDFVDRARGMVSTDVSQVRVQALAYLAILSHEREAMLAGYLRSDDLTTRSAALQAIAQLSSNYPNLIENTPFRQTFEEIYGQFNQAENQRNEQHTTMLATLAAIIGEARTPALYPHLEALLRNSKVRVLRQAIQSAGTNRDPRFLPLLLGHLSTKLVRKDAREALANYGEAAIAPLAKQLINPDQTARVRSGIPRALALIGSQKTVDLLLEQLDKSDLRLRTELVHAMHRLRENYPLLEFNRRRLDAKILEEVQRYLSTLQCLLEFRELNLGSSNGASAIAEDVNSVQGLIVRTLKERLGGTMDRLFDLLGVRYRPEDMDRARVGIASNNNDLKANAIEFLDNVLHARLKRWIVPLVETDEPEELLQWAIKQPGALPENKNDCISTMVSGDDNWLKACTLYLLARTGSRKSLQSKLIKERAGDPILLEMQSFAKNLLPAPI